MLSRNSGLKMSDALLMLKTAVIRRRGNGFVLLSREGKVLGKHATRAKAIRQEHAIQARKHASVIGVDLDATLATYHGWKGIEHIGQPIPKMVARVKRWLREGNDVRIFTARASNGKKAINIVKDWCEEVIGKRLPVTNVKTPDITRIYDDRAVQIEKNTGEKVAATQAQLIAGNYPKDHLAWNGLRLAFENRKGTIRKGTDSSGKAWRVKMPFDYGYVNGTKGKDGDHVDLFMGPNPASYLVYVINQRNLRSKRFDEHKCMAGFRSKQDAVQAYDLAYDKGLGPRLRMGVKTMTVPQFKNWVKDNARTQKQAQTVNTATPQDYTAALEGAGLVGRTPVFRALPKPPPPPPKPPLITRLGAAAFRAGDKLKTNLANARTLALGNNPPIVNPPIANPPIANPPIANPPIANQAKGIARFIPKFAPTAKETAGLARVGRLGGSLVRAAGGLGRLGGRIAGPADIVLQGYGMYPQIKDKGYVQGIRAYNRDEALSAYQEAERGNFGNKVWTGVKRVGLPAAAVVAPGVPLSMRIGSAMRLGSLAGGAMTLAAENRNRQNNDDTLLANNELNAKRQQAELARDAADYYKFRGQQHPELQRGWDRLNDNQREIVQKIIAMPRGQARRDLINQQRVSITPTTSQPNSPTVSAGMADYSPSAVADRALGILPPAVMTPIKFKSSAPTTNAQTLGVGAADASDYGADAAGYPVTTAKPLPTQYQTNETRAYLDQGRNGGWVDQTKPPLELKPGTFNNLVASNPSSYMWGGSLYGQPMSRAAYDALITTNGGRAQADALLKDKKIQLAPPISGGFAQDLTDATAPVNPTAPVEPSKGLVSQPLIDMVGETPIKATGPTLSLTNQTAPDIKQVTQAPGQTSAPAQTQATAPTPVADTNPGGTPMPALQTQFYVPSTNTSTANVPTTGTANVPTAKATTPTASSVLAGSKLDPAARGGSAPQVKPTMSAAPAPVPTPASTPAPSPMSKFFKAPTQSYTSTSNVMK